jgi:TRAP-type mannitol/chloroaromatic compound transport system permease small subunit
MGRHDPDPGGRFRYVLAALVVIALIALIALGISALHALA